MVLHKKLFILIIIFSLVAVLFPSISRAANSDYLVDVAYTHKSVTINNMEDYLCRQQDSWLNYIYIHNRQVFNMIRDNFLNNQLFYYIQLNTNFTKNDHYNFKIYFYEIAYPDNLSEAFDNNDILEANYNLYSNEIGSLYKINQTLTENYIELTISEDDAINAWNYIYKDHVFIHMCLVGRVSDYFIRLIDNNSSNSNSNDYTNVLYSIYSCTDSLLYNSSTILNDIQDIKNYTNQINNKLSTTNTYLSNIQGAINNGTTNITNTIVSTHDLDNSNDNKNTNEIITAINDNTNSINSLQNTNDNSDIVNAINNGFSNLNSNNNSNTNEIVSTINNVSEDIINEQNNNTNTIISNSNSNTNDIVQAIEDNSSPGSPGGITNTELNSAVSSINDNNNDNTNRILADTVTEDNTDIFDSVVPPEMENPTPDLSNKLIDFGNQLTTSHSGDSKTFILPLNNKNYTVTLYYNELYNRFFSKNLTFYYLWQALWWVLIGFFVFRKCKRIYNELLSGEWDEIMTKTDIHDDIIDGSVK